MKKEFEKTTGILPLMLKLEGVLALLNVDFEIDERAIEESIEELSEVVFNDRIIKQICDRDLDLQQQAMVVFEVLLHLDETRWFAGEERMLESSDQAVVQVGRIAESLVHILTDKMIDFVKLPGTAYESIPWLLGRLVKLIDFDADLLLAAAKACGSAERYDGLKALLYQGLDMLGGVEQGMDTIKATHTEVQAMLEAQGIDEDIAGILIEVQESLNMPLLAILLSIKSQNDCA